MGVVTMIVDAVLFGAWVVAPVAVIVFSAAFCAYIVSGAARGKFIGAFAFFFFVGGMTWVLAADLPARIEKDVPSLKCSGPGSFQVSVWLGSLSEAQRLRLVQWRWRWWRNTAHISEPALRWLAVDEMTCREGMRMLRMGAHQ